MKIHESLNLISSGLPDARIPQRIGAVKDLAQRIVARLKDEFSRRQLSQRAVAKRLGQITGVTWTQPGVQKVLAGQVRLTVNDFAALAEIAGLSLVELVREPGRELLADLTPSELRLLEAVRFRPEYLSHMLALIGPIETPRSKRQQRAIIKERMRRQD